MKRVGVIIVLVFLILPLLKVPHVKASTADEIVMVCVGTEDELSKGTADCEYLRKPLNQVLEYIVTKKCSSLFGGRST